MIAHAKRLPLMATIAILSCLEASGESPGAPRKVWAEMMGSWRMTGQPRRGSSQGAWTSAARAEWSDPSLKSLNWRISEPRTVREIAFRIDPRTGDADSVELTLDEIGVRSLKRRMEASEDRFVFEEEAQTGRDPLRLTLSRKSRDRWTGTLETRRGGSAGWSRTAELGMTRQGATIAVGSGQAECVVTGGLGEIALMINGKTVYVCCSGCRETLLADPDSFLKPASRPDSASSSGPIEP